MIDVSVEKAVKDIRKEFKDLTNREFNSGVARAINHTLAKAKTTSSKEIRSVYSITAKDVGKSISIRKANSAQMYGYVISQGVPLPLSRFKPSQNKQGVTVLIKKGNRQLIRGAFIATMGNGHTGIFARGTYKGGGGDFVFRKKRLIKASGYTMKNGRRQPIQNDLNINELTTLSVPRAFAHKTVLAAIAKNINDEFPKRMMHELNRIRG